MHNIIIGTAGHVDHGKTSLIKALTGIDADRLEEEKKRGITIDLGFADMLGPSGQHFGIIDVPGHERFIRNMLAGIGGIDLVLLVIAADEGVMPQTVEHFEILKTLQIKQERLLALMEKADLMEDIIALENSLSDVQYEIEQLTSTLKRYDGLVDFASITVQVNQVIKLSDDPGEADSLGERLAAAFTNGFSDFGKALGNFTVWIAYHFIGTIIFAAVVAMAVIAGRRFYRRQGKRNDPPAK
jgi:small GTP-binding protein